MPAPTPAGVVSPSQGASAASPSNLTRHLCSIQKTTGAVPPGLVGASTTIVGDKLYVFGGRRPLRSPPVLSQRIYELDLPRRHWSRIIPKGSPPSPRYFHTMCGLGDSKLVCYGGMAFMNPTQAQASPSKDKAAASAAASDPPIVVMSDVHIFDIATHTWTAIDAANAPPGRYAHCSTILPSTSIWTSASAPRSALHHNQPSQHNPNHGSVGIDIDGSGGAEMIVVGGQDAASAYLDQICVFNLRSLQWTSLQPLNRSCGAYRSVVAPLTELDGRKVGTLSRSAPLTDDDLDPEGSSALIYSNYNFMNVELSLQVRLSDGTTVEKAMEGPETPPGLRFPTGGVVGDRFVVSGTYMTSTKQEYCLWTLDLRTLQWARMEFGGGLFAAGSWNKGLVWSRRSAFVISGDRRRNLAEDYQLRRINFANICIVELEAFGLYDNPRVSVPTSSYVSRSASVLPSKQDAAAGGRPMFASGVMLGLSVLTNPQLADMQLLAIGGERIPVNSHVVSRRWGPYFAQLLREGSLVTSPTGEATNGTSTAAETSTLRQSTSTSTSPASHHPRNSSITITPTTSNSSPSDSKRTSAASPVQHRASLNPAQLQRRQTLDLSPSNDPAVRPRSLYLPHTLPTVQALAYYLYTSTLPPLHIDGAPPTGGVYCTPQILCSLLQIARPYRVDGLLESIIDQLHQVPDGRHTPAVFNAAAMAAGGGDSVAFVGDSAARSVLLDKTIRSASRETARQVRRHHDGAASESESEGYSTESEAGESEASAPDDEELWAGEVSAVVGLQLRGLRGLLEGRRLRETQQTGTAAGGGGAGLGVSGVE